MGFLLRLWKIDFSLPVAIHGDESFGVYIALNMGSGDLNPHHFMQPPLYYYFYFLGDVIYILWGRMTGIFKNLRDAWVLYKTDPSVFYVIGRIVSALFGGLTIPLTYGAGKKVFGERTGLLAAFFFTFCFLHIQWSSIAYVDIPFTFFVVLTFILSYSAFEKGKPGRAVPLRERADRHHHRWLASESCVDAGGSESGGRNTAALANGRTGPCRSHCSKYHARDPQRSVNESFFAAVVLSHVLFQRGEFDLLPGTWMLLYGCGALAMSFFTPLSIRALGSAFLAAGAFALVFLPGHDVWAMGLSFGGIHLAWGIGVSLQRYIFPLRRSADGVMVRDP